MLMYVFRSVSETSKNTPGYSVIQVHFAIVFLASAVWIQQLAKPLCYFGTTVIRAHVESRNELVSLVTSGNLSFHLSNINFPFHSFVSQTRPPSPGNNRVPSNAYWMPRRHLRTVLLLINQQIPSGAGCYGDHATKRHSVDGINCVAMSLTLVSPTLNLRRTY
jgi:hypothetical protein